MSITPRHLPRITRDAVLMAVGVVMLAYETLAGTDRPALIAAAVTLTGLPFALWSDRDRQLKDGMK